MKLLRLIAVLGAGTWMARRLAQRTGHDLRALAHPGGLLASARGARRGNVEVGRHTSAASAANASWIDDRDVIVAGGDFPVFTDERTSR